MPLLGFGVYQNYSAKPAVLEAFKAGYRQVLEFRRDSHELISLCLWFCPD